MDIKKARGAFGCREERPCFEGGYPLTYAYEEIDSTNAEARRYAADGGPTPALFVAERQSAGRGRQGRSFYSEKGVYMTLLVSGEGDLTGITAAAAVAALHATDGLTGGRAEIKWVNDLLLDGKKFCGILAESFSVGERRFVSVGVGVNVGTSRFPEELSAIACSVGSESDRAEVTDRLADELCRLIAASAMGDREYMREYRERSAVLGRRIVFTRDGEARKATAESIRDDGALLVRTDCGELVTLSGGEISIRF